MLGDSPCIASARSAAPHTGRHDDHVTEKLNELYSDVDSSFDTVLSTLQFRSLPRDKW